jgi:gamma-glutamylcyclotransferase (GGCT)/AIG2-like uncharacterized protein YtfP
MNLFAYGTLRFAEVWRRIGLREFPSESAILRGYAIFRVVDVVYPGVTQAASNECVEGSLFRDLDDETVSELDAYESTLYDRKEVVVETASGEQVTCQAYIIPKNRRNSLTNEAWCIKTFRDEHLQGYLGG